MELDKISEPIRLDLVDNFHRISSQMSRYDVLKSCRILSGGDVCDEAPTDAQLDGYMRNLERGLPAGLRRVYINGLSVEAAVFDEANGNCLDPDDFLWAAVTASGLTRARAYVAAGVLVMLRGYYEQGIDLPCLNRIREEASIAAAESGADREGDYDAELWESSHFEELFRPIEGVDL